MSPTPVQSPERTQTAASFCGRHFAIRSSSHRVVKYDPRLKQFTCENVNNHERSVIAFDAFMDAIHLGIVVFPSVRR